jgi:hypothetical protein
MLVGKLLQIFHGLLAGRRRARPDKTPDVMRQKLRKLRPGQDNPPSANGAPFKLPAANTSLRCEPIFHQKRAGVTEPDIYPAAKGEEPVTIGTPDELSLDGTGVINSGGQVANEPLSPELPIVGLSPDETMTAKASDVIFVEFLNDPVVDVKVSFDHESANVSELEKPETVLVNQWEGGHDQVLPADALLPDKSADAEQVGGAGNFGKLASTDAEEENSSDQGNPFENCSEESLKQLAGSNSTPARILSWMASHVDPEIRAQVARNKNALPETIWLLAKDYDESVRLSIAEDLEANPAILKTLCHDESLLVAWRAKNTLYLLHAGAGTGAQFAHVPPPSIPLETPKSAPNVTAEINEVNVEELNFLKVIAQKASTPARRLAELARHPSEEVRALVAENANAPLEALWSLARDSEGAVKLKLIENYNCPIDIIEALQEDKDSFVSWQARNMLLKLMRQSTDPINLTEEEMKAPLIHSR